MRYFVDLKCHCGDDADTIKCSDKIEKYYITEWDDGESTVGIICANHFNLDKYQLYWKVPYINFISLVEFKLYCLLAYQVIK